MANVLLEDIGSIFYHHLVFVFGFDHTVIFRFDLFVGASGNQTWLWKMSHLQKQITIMPSFLEDVPSGMITRGSPHVSSMDGRMGVSKNGGTPKCMVCKGNPIHVDDLEVS